MCSSTKLNDRSLPVRRTGILRRAAPTAFALRGDAVTAPVRSMDTTEKGRQRGSSASTSSPRVGATLLVRGADVADEARRQVLSPSRSRVLGLIPGSTRRGVEVRRKAGLHRDLGIVAGRRRVFVLHIVADDKSGDAAANQHRPDHTLTVFPLKAIQCRAQGMEPGTSVAGPPLYSGMPIVPPARNSTTRRTPASTRSPTPDSIAFGSNDRKNP